MTVIGMHSPMQLMHPRFMYYNVHIHVCTCTLYVFMPSVCTCVYCRYANSTDCISNVGTYMYMYMYVYCTCTCASTCMCCRCANSTDCILILSNVEYIYIHVHVFMHRCGFSHVGSAPETRLHSGTVRKAHLQQVLIYSKY